MTSREEKDIFLIYAVILTALFMSKGLAFFPALGLDDYEALHQGRDPFFYLWQGRFTQAMIQVMLTKLGLSSTAIAWPIIVLFFGFLALAITMGILFVAQNKGSVLGLSAIGAVIASHPYLTEYFTFRESLITQGASFALISLVFLVWNRYLFSNRLVRFPYWAATMLLMILLAGAQQTAFIILGFFIIAELVCHSIGKDSYKYTLDCRYGLLIIYLLSACIYVVIYFLIRDMSTGAMESRGSFINLNDLGNRMELITSLNRKLLFDDEPVLSNGVKLYSFGVFLVLLLLVGFNSIKSFFVIGIAAGLFYIGSIFLVSISKVWWPVPRAVYAIGFAFGLSLLLAYVNASHRFLKFFPVAMFLSALGLAFHSSTILYDQIRLNRWDAWVAQGIAHDLITLTIEDEFKVILVGASWVHPLGLSTIDGDLNSSALAVSWAAQDLFMEVTGRKWNLESITTAPECDGVPAWPKQGAIKQGKDAIYVCLRSLVLTN